MERKKIVQYLLTIALIIGASCVLPHLIRAGTDMIISRFSKDSAPEEETEHLDERYESGALAGSEQQEVRGNGFDLNDLGERGENDPGDSAPDLSPEEEQARKDQTDQERLTYRERVSAPISEARAGLKEVFIEGKEDDFRAALADHLFSVYGDLFEVTEIELISFISDTEEEIVFQVQVSAAIGAKEYSEYYYCTYNKPYDFYSVYAYQE